MLTDKEKIKELHADLKNEKEIRTQVEEQRDFFAKIARELLQIVEEALK